MKQREDWKWSWENESEKKNEKDDGVEMAEIVDEEIDPGESIPHKTQQQKTEQTQNRDCCSSTNNNSNSSCRMNIRNIYIGLALIGMGVVWLLNNLKMIDWRTFDILFSWQMLLVVLGGYFLVLRKWALGGIFMAIGAVLVNQAWFGCHIPLAKIILPAALIAGGIAIALQRK